MEVHPKKAEEHFTIRCMKCSHENNPSLTSCFKCNSDLDRSNISQDSYMKPPIRGWFDFIFLTNAILCILAWIHTIFFFTAGLIVFHGFFILGRGLALWTVVFTYVSFGLGRYQKYSRNNYLLVLCISLVICGLSESIAFFITFFVLLYGIGLNKENIEYYDWKVKIMNL